MHTSIRTVEIVLATGSVPPWHVKGVFSGKKAEASFKIVLSVIMTLARVGVYCNFSKPVRFVNFSFPLTSMEAGGQVSPEKSVRFVKAVFRLHTRMCTTNDKTPCTSVGMRRMTRVGLSTAACLQ